MANKERNAEGYIRNHKILELFENLTAQLIFERPGEYSLRLLLNVFVTLCVGEITGNLNTERIL